MYYINVLGMVCRCECCLANVDMITTLVSDWTVYLYMAWPCTVSCMYIVWYVLLPHADGEKERESQEDQDRHVAALKRMYPKSHHFLDSQLGLTLTPVQEEDIDLFPPLPPLPGETSSSPPLPPLPGETSSSPLPPLPGETSSSPLPPLAGEVPASPTPYISPLPPLPGEQMPSVVLPEVAALASVRESVREMEQLQNFMDSPTAFSPPTTEGRPPLRPVQCYMYQSCMFNDSRRCRGRGCTGSSDENGREGS